MKTLTVIALILVATVAYAHIHAWSKTSEWDAIDGYGNDIKVCNWTCNSYDGSHSVQTSGMGFCPVPY